MFGSGILELDLILGVGFLAQRMRGVALIGVLPEVVIMLLCYSCIISWNSQKSSPDGSNARDC